MQYIIYFASKSVRVCRQPNNLKPFFCWNWIRFKGNGKANFYAATTLSAPLTAQIELPPFRKEKKREICLELIDHLNRCFNFFLFSFMHKHKLINGQELKFQVGGSLMFFLANFA